MFERFSSTARAVVIGAQLQARELGHQYIDTEHLLLAMIDPRTHADGPVDSLARDVLRESGIDVAYVLAYLGADVEETAGNLGDADAAALEAIGIDLGAVRAKLEENFGPGALEETRRPPSRRRGLFRRPRRAGGSGHIPFTPQAKKVLELSLREAIHLRHSSISSEHMLLGLLREGRGLAATILTDAGLNLATLRRQIVAGMDQAA